MLFVMVVQAYMYYKFVKYARQLLLHNLIFKMRQKLKDILGLRFKLVQMLMNTYSEGE
jgi:hypothetical protein